MSIEFGAKSDVGKVRTNNEDSYAVTPDTGLFIVADGMGGHNSGEVASKMAVEVAGRNFSQAIARHEAEPDKTQVLFGNADPLLSETANYLVSSIHLANQVLTEASRSSKENQGMGTTFAAVVVGAAKYTVAWVGDSRVYLVRHNQLQQLSTDHSLVQEQVAKGLITPEQAETSEFKNILTRALGVADTVTPDTVEIEAFDDDYILLCSDGLTRMVPDQEILAIIREAAEPQAACDRLIERALQNGGRDNVTAVIVHRRQDGIWKKILKAVK
jgi:protein phosphatase